MKFQYFTQCVVLTIYNMLFSFSQALTMTLQHFEQSVKNFNLQIAYICFSSSFFSVNEYFPCRRMNFVSLCVLAIASVSFINYYALSLKYILFAMFINRKEHPNIYSYRRCSKIKHTIYTFHLT